jgi:hypothetical protein
MEEEAQLFALKQTKLRLARQHQEAWGGFNDLQTPSPLTYSTPGTTPLVLDMLPASGPRPISPEPSTPGYGFHDREKRGGGGSQLEDSMSTPNNRRVTQKESKMTTVPCQRKPSR